MKKLILLLMFIAGGIIAQDKLVNYIPVDWHNRPVAIMYVQVGDDFYPVKSDTNGVMQVDFGTDASYTRVDTVFNIGTTITQLSSLIGTVDLTGGGLHIVNQQTGESVAVGSSTNAGIGATNTGDILLYKDTFDDWGGFYTSSDDVWLKGSAATTYIRIKMIHQ